MVVPFFGDQPFWGISNTFWCNEFELTIVIIFTSMNIGDMICQAGAGPQPIPQKLLNADNLTEAIKFTQAPAAQAAAQQMGSQIRSEVNHQLYIRIIFLGLIYIKTW